MEAFYSILDDGSDGKLALYAQQIEGKKLGDAQSMLSEHFKYDPLTEIRASESLRILENNGYWIFIVRNDVITLFRQAKFAEAEKEAELITQ